MSTPTAEEGRPAATDRQWLRLGAWQLGLLLVAVLALDGIATWKVAHILRGFRSPGDLITSWVDEHIEAGYQAPVIEPDDPVLAQRAIIVTHALNERTAQDVVGRLIYLNARDPNRPIDLYLSTPGGWTISAFTIIDAMRLIKAPVNTWAIGGCYSGGAMVLAAGTGRRYAARDAILMVHANSASEDDDSFDRLDNRRIEEFWHAVARLPDKWFPMTGGEEYYLTAQEAQEYGFVDSIVPSGTGRARAAANGAPVAGSREASWRRK
jgi:ATP-dependent Clp protease protease subunit